MNGEEIVTECLKSVCSWNKKGEIICDSGNGSCAFAKFNTANRSEFHDDILRTASQQIQVILNAIPEDSKGRQLALLNTTTGVLLAWVHHGIEVPEDSVTIEDGFEAIAEALGLSSEETSYPSKGY